MAGRLALLSIEASYLALSEYVTVVPRFWLPGPMALLVTILLISHALGPLPTVPDDLFRVARHRKCLPSPP
jgi:hypothetical protein